MATKKLEPADGGGALDAAEASSSPTTPFLAQLLYALAWGAVFVACAMSAVGSIDMAGQMDESRVHVDVMLGWGLGACVQWLIVEPLLLLALFFGGLLLKWLTSFEGLVDRETGAIKKVEPPIKGIKNKAMKSRSAETDGASATSSTPTLTNIVPGGSPKKPIKRSFVA